MDIIFIFLCLFSVGMGIIYIDQSSLFFWLSGQPAFNLLDLIIGVLFISFGVWFLFMGEEEQERSYERAKEKYLKENKLFLNKSITLRHEKIFEGKPKKLISIKWENGQEYLTDVCIEDDITPRHHIYIFGFSNSPYTVVVYDKFAREWKVYSHLHAIPS